MYQKPVVRSESIEILNASGQYVFQITPACPGFFNDGVTHTAQGLAYCSDGGDDPFEADISCQNISGTFHVSYGAGVPGGGLSCGSSQSFVDPIISVSPELPDDCIITEFVFNNSFDDCSVR